MLTKNTLNRIKNSTLTGLLAFEHYLRTALAAQDSGIAGFQQFYRLLFDRDLPHHALHEWLPAIYTAKEEGKGAVIEAFRGSAKTTTLTIAWLAFQIGHNPHKSNLLIQVSDEAAQDTAGQIADLIATNQGWRLVFPHIVPDRKAGWGASGYEVKRTDLEYADWRKLCAQEKGKDPTLVGLGYRSRAVIGKHPTGVLLVDDIHDENNTRSARELDTVRRILTGTILPTVTPQTWQVFIGTPWTLNDVLAYLKTTGHYASIQTPILRQDSPQPPDHPSSSVENAKHSPKAKTSSSPRLQPTASSQPTEKIPTWQQRFPLSAISDIRQLTGEIEFTRMFLLDLKAAAGIHLKREWLKTYPNHKIDPKWPVIMGVDYASSTDGQQDDNRDYFAVAIGRALPRGSGMVVVDGFRGQLSQAEAEEKLITLAEQYPTTQIIGVESIGKGEEFYHLMLRTSRLPIRAVHPGGQTKGQRFQIGMAPLFERGQAKIAEIDNGFIKDFRDEWVGWPHTPHDDTLDAVYWMLYVGVPHLIGPQAKRKKQENPFETLGRT